MSIEPFAGFRERLFVFVVTTTTGKLKLQSRRDLYVDILELLYSVFR